MACAIAASSLLVSRSALTARPAKAARPQRAVIAAAADRTTWLPDVATPPYLNGELPGDFGFDPLGLGSDPERLKWYAEAERTNARWAMMGALGIMGQELLGVSPKWYAVGTKEYWTTPLALHAISFAVFGFLELKRYQGWQKYGTSGVLDQYPFDPLGQNSPSMATKELKNGRLAMIAIVGFAVQALVTHEGPLEGLSAHISDPFNHNIIGNIANMPNVMGK